MTNKTDRIAALRQRLENGERLLAGVVADHKSHPYTPGLGEVLTAVGDWVARCREDLRRAEATEEMLSTLLPPADEVVQ